VGAAAEARALAASSSTLPRTLYVGGLDESVGPDVLRAAFLPFGELRWVDAPRDNATGKGRGFGFVEFEDGEDAAEAAFNMDGAEIAGRAIRVNAARGAPGGGGGAARGQAVWANEEWLAGVAAANGEGGGEGGAGGGSGGGGR